MGVSCQGGIIHTIILSSPIGDMKVAGCPQGLHFVKHCDEDDTNFYPDESRQVAIKDTTSGSPNCEAVDKSHLWLKDYFTYREARTSIPLLCPSVSKSDTFCGKALQILPKAVPFGKTISYKDLALLCGNVHACRAAGHAMATNPASLLIPCHRVVSSSGDPGNYSHGKKNKIKRWLLDFEQKKKCKK